MSNSKLHWMAKKLVHHNPLENESVIYLAFTDALWHMRFSCYICYCANCGKWFYSTRPHALTCSDKCRKGKSRLKPHQYKSVTLPEKQALTQKSGSFAK